MNNRKLKDLLYEQVARMGKALASPKRLELLELLAQSEKSVEMLTAELAIDVKLASAHLKALRDARLVQSRREGKYIFYRLSGSDVAQLGVCLRTVAEEHLVEMRLALQQLVAEPDTLIQTSRADLLQQARSGQVVHKQSLTPPTCRLPARCRWLSWSNASASCRRMRTSWLIAADRFA